MGSRKRPTKVRNISGLRNQRRDSFSAEDSWPVQASRSLTSTTEGLVNEAELKIAFDGLKANYMEETSDSEEDSEREEISDWEDLNDKAFSELLAEIALKDDPKDADWIPEKLKRSARTINDGTTPGLWDSLSVIGSQCASVTARPSQYAKGPDMMNKSKCTQRHYLNAWKSQSALDSFGFGKIESKSLLDTPPYPFPSPSDPILPTNPVELPQPVIGHTQSASVLSEESDTRQNVEEEELSDSEDMENWELELETVIQGPKEMVRDWAMLCLKIQMEVKKKSRTLPYSCIKQLMILSNFATLRLKGLS
jgi:hypothetical protein